MKAGCGSDPLLSRTGDQKTFSETHKKKNEDVNVHPDSAERSDDRLDSQKGDVNNAESRNEGEIKGENDRV